MPAVSQAQQKLMGQAYALKKGELKPEDLNPEYREQIEDLAKGMTLKQLEDYAKTSLKGLPKKVKEMRHIPTFEAFINEAKINEGSNPQEQIKKNCIERLSQFFRVPGSRLMKFKFDGTDDVRQYADALDATSYEGAEAYYKMAIKLAKEDLGIHESLNEAGDLAYWKQYEKSSTKIGEESWSGDVAKNPKELQSLYDEIVNWWDTESEEAGHGLPLAQRKEYADILDLANDYLKKFKSINGRIIDAMISQLS